MAIDPKKSYVLIKLVHEFDLMEEDKDGNLIPLSPKHLPENAYLYRGMIGEVHFPETETIGANCFKMCSSLEIVDIPNAKHIGNGAFNGCISLEEVLMPCLKSIGNSTFQGCGELKYTDFSAVESIGYNAFQDCEKLETLSLPLVSKVGDNTFRGCKNLKKLQAPMLTEIGRAAFYGCSSLDVALFPGVTKIGTATSNQEIDDGVFQKCTKLKSVTLPSLTQLSENTFKKCSQLKYISLPNMTSEAIQGRVFGDCKGLVLLNLQSAMGVGNVSESGSTLGIPESCIVLCMEGDVSWGNHQQEDFEFSESCYQRLDHAIGDTLPSYLKSTPDAQIKDGMMIEALAQGMKSGAVSGKESLELAVLVNVMYELEPGAFNNCPNLNEVALPKKWFNEGAPLRDYGIAPNAFVGCPNMKCLELPSVTMAAVGGYLGSSFWGLPPGCAIVCKDGVIPVPMPPPAP